jgi:hypothetical protein
MSGNEGPIRIGDQEREEAVAQLGKHYEAGRLSAEEHQERVGEALQAKTEADLAALFGDLPGAAHAGTPGAGGPAPSDEQGWAGPWTAPQDSTKGGAAGRPPYGPGPFRRVPLPLLIALAVIGVLASIGCVVGSGHPPVLPLLLIVAAFFIVKRRRQERRA